jgi:hypothetical protein
MRSLWLGGTIVAAIALSAWLVVELVPETLHFPVVKYSTPEGANFAVYPPGEMDGERCSKRAAAIASPVRSSCPRCTVTQLCTSGLDAAHRQILSRNPLETASLRAADGKLTMTVSAGDPAAAETYCRVIETHSSSQPPSARLRCFPGRTAR